jgi:hypothetical protein
MASVFGTGPVCSGWHDLKLFPDRWALARSPAQDSEKSLARDLIREGLFPDKVVRKRMNPKSGNRFSDKVMRKGARP